jgi:cytosine/adenosine deaminase-related metal-dependent hydrolase
MCGDWTIPPATLVPTVFTTMSAPRLPLLPPLDFSRPVKLRARCIAPVTAAPFAGFLELDGGRVTALSTTADATAVDLGNVAVLPGLVNAHTHLELSDCAAPLETRQHFTEWVGDLLAHRRARPVAGEGRESPVTLGARELRATGTTQAGDIVDASWSPGLLPAGGPGGVAFLEVLGFGAERRGAMLELAQAHLRSNASRGGPDWLRGLSPHAPYSVHRELLPAVVDLAVATGTPVAMHVAETVEERELLDRQTGPYVPFLDRMGVPWRGGLCDSILGVLRELARAPRALVVHGNDLGREEIDFLAGQPQMTVVYCPRTHAAFGHGLHPWPALLARGVPIAVGTDSRASNPNLSLWEELQFLAGRHPELPAATLLAWGTRNGARALWGEAPGREGGPRERGPGGGTGGEIRIGERAELTVVGLEAGVSDPLTQLFAPRHQPLATLRGSDWQACDPVS